ncbi:MAG: tRNA (adenosine(37)-N6)-threonylcarbamoyltransferase complex transferase subunit TsaD [Nitrospiraceae bacterium]
MYPRPLILGIETSCDETAAAVVDRDGRVASSVLSSQHDVHGKYGGVVPELASRRHIETVEGIVTEAMRQAGLPWSNLSAVAVTRGPGLAGALLVGVSFGKALAYALKIPVLGVNHLEGHLASAWIDEPDFPRPCIVLVVSGGHTHLFLVETAGVYRLLGRTLDDAAGEAFDKAAKMLALGYPGGPAIDRMARIGNAAAIRFPRPYRLRSNLDFSFSGIKTALLYYLRDLERSGKARSVSDIAAGFQEAIVEVLVDKAFEAVRRCHVDALAVVGGVSANTRLRALLSERARTTRVRLSLPRAAYCTDNAVMIAKAGQWAYAKGRFDSWDMEADADWTVPESHVPVQREELACGPRPGSSSPGQVAVSAGREAHRRRARA